MEEQTVNIHDDIINRCIEGDEVAQFELYRLYSKAMYNTALRICGASSDAEDVLQEAFVSAFDRLHTYRREAAFGAWLKRIVINKALNHLRTQQKYAMMMEDTHEHLEVAESTDELTELQVQHVKDALFQLPVGFRTVLSLYLLEGYDHREISEILGIAESTSKTQYKRAKERLKDVLRSKLNYG
ncbi:RNA polymerase sigma factor [Marinoscillum furvescens]|uniref:RNA polymerase sigma factor n=1 Tax=Marinoscillum furvescens DSM 4134 TaxID=1122208 RepID=A0A3D9L128_MARFU|nr:RNA polymerase sigma factor [Marinoscillum furvescens]RED97443.1 RNA polymerase sigma-70 factor (ECF subfamily) [Marinoscillum furvescens DSM 4134]